MKSLAGSTFVFLLLVFALSAGISAAESGQPEPEPVTTGNPDIPLDELALRLKPLMRAELEVEAAGWLALLQAKVSEISTAEISAKQKKARLKKVDAVKDALQEVEKAKQQVEKTPVDKEAAEQLQKAEQEAEQVISEARETIQKADEDKAAAEIEEAARRKAEQEEGEKLPQAPADKVIDNKVSVEEIDQSKAKVEEFTEAEAETRSSLLSYLTDLRAQQTALTDRTNAVIDELEEKGGDVEEYRQYVSAVSGIKVDVSDAEAVWTTVYGWLTSAEGGLRWLKNILIFLATVLFFIFVSNLVGKALEKVFARSRQTSRLLKEFLIITIQRLVIAVGVLIGLAALEVNIGPLLAVIGAAGFVIAFALQNSLGNFASGILILVFKPFDVGDVVEVSGVLGKVQSMNLLSVLIHTPDNKSVIVPNNQIWGDAITNVTGTRTRRVDLVFGIAYDDDIEQAQRVLEQVVSEHERILKDPEPVIRLHELADSSVNFVCRPWVKTEDYWDVYWDLTRSVKERFDKEGISIPFPQRDVHLFNALPQSAGSGG